MSDSKKKYRIGIGITTKNRHEDLDFTINDLKSKGYASVRILLVDDGSDVPIQDKWPEMDVSIVRFETSAGLIERRNFIASHLDADYYISLDDDSSFDAPCAPERIVAYLDTHPQVGALSLNYTEAGHDGLLLEAAMSPCASFTGCAHVLRVSAFLEAGGYRPFFVHMCEENDLTLRMADRNWTVMQWPAILVNHRKSAASRYPARNWYFQCRNTVLIWGLDLPVPLAALKIAKTFVGCFVISFRHKRPLASALRGFIAGCFGILQHWQSRSPIQYASYSKWAKLYYGPKA
jgi:GT2 family glycosyltransferase